MTIKKISDFSEETVFFHLEDMKTTLKEMKNDLKALGFKGKIIQAETLQEALSYCSKNRIDFFISDWNLPDGTGLQFLKEIRATEKFSKTPFVMCTTMDKISDMCNAVTEGSNDYIVKPWEKSELEKKIILTWNFI